MITFTNDAFGLRLRSAREAIGLRQSDLAKIVGCGAQHISDMERGRRGCSADMLVILAQVLRVSTDYLLIGASLPAAVTDGAIDWRKFGSRLKTVRIERKMTQKELLTEMSYSRNQHISELEQGDLHCSITCLSELIQLLGTNADYLLFGIGDPDIPATDFYIKTRCYIT